MAAAARDRSEVQTIPSGAAENVVSLHLRVLPRHLDEASSWVRAGSRMGLLDVAITEDVQQALVVWVRESSEPAYLVTPVRMDWVVTDYTSGRKLGAFRQFAQALRCIRPIC